MYLYLGEVLPNILRTCHNFFLGNPLFQIIYFSLQLVKLESLVQLAAPFLSQILESFV